MEAIPSQMALHLRIGFRPVHMTIRISKDEMCDGKMIFLLGVNIISLNVGMKMLCRKRKDISFVKPSLYFFIYTTPGYFWIDTEIRQTPASLPFRKRRFTVMRLGIYGKKNL